MWKTQREETIETEEQHICNEDETELQSKYQTANKQVRRSARRDRLHFFDSLATEAEQAVHKRNMKTFYKVTKTLSNKKRLSK